MAKEMLINVSEGEECRIALLDDGKLEELYMERTSSTSHVGNIYKGRVTNVEPSIQAAFVDFGLGRNGFLHISDLMPTYFGRSGDNVPQETVGRKMARRDRPPIQRCLRRGDDIVVQIIKEGIGTKGPTLSTYLSIPGRILVMMPGMAKMGVSRKIEDDEERRRLRQILDSLKPIDDVGFIIRTAGVGKTKAEIQRDLTYLTRLWQTLVKKRDSGPGPTELYTEGDLVTRTVRDVFSTDIDLIVADNKDVVKRVKEVIKLANPRTKNKVELYEGGVPLFHKYGIEREIEQMYSRHVPLPSGGSLVIDSTEAIVAIDVNSGKFREHADAETTAFKTDMEAADEIPRQLRLRDLGGVIICDFIDLRYERHRRDLEAKLHANFQKDRAKTKVLRMSQFGIIEMTRQRMRPSLKRSIYFDCPHCKGAGLVKTPESMSLDVMRRLAIAANDLKVARVEMSVNPEVNFYLQNKKRRSLAELEDRTGKRIVIRADTHLGLDEVKLELFDSRDGLVTLPELTTTQPPHTTQLGTRPHGAKGQQSRGGDHGRRGGRGGGGGGQGQHRRPEPRDEDSVEMDRLEDAVDQREEDLDDESEATGPATHDRRDQRGGHRQGRPPAQAPRPIPAESYDARSGDAEDDLDAADAGSGDEHLPPDIGTEAASESVEPDETDIGDAAPARQDYPDQGERDFDNGEGGGRRRRRRRRRRGRGNGNGGGGNYGNYDRDRDRGGVQPQEQSVGGDRRYENEYDVGEDDRADTGQRRSPQHQGGGQRQPDQRDRNGYRQDDRNRAGGGGGRGGHFDENRNRASNDRQPPRDSGHGNQRGQGYGQGGPGGQSGQFRQDGNAGSNYGDEAGGGRRRRRRRRGRRGRGRGGEGQPMAPGQQPFAPASEDLPVEAEAPTGDFADEPFDNAEAAADMAEGDLFAQREPLGDAPTEIVADDRRSTRPDDDEAATEAAEAEAPMADDLPEDAPAPEAEEKPAPKRRRAASAKSKKSTRAKAADSTESVAAKKPRKRASSSSSSRRGRTKKAGTPTDASGSRANTSQPPAPVVRTGSADKHMADDEPVIPQPVSRPRSFRDLDAIPDDFD
jgi:ribonuclease E